MGIREESNRAETASGGQVPGAGQGHKEPAGCWLATAWNAVPPSRPGARAETSCWGETNPRPGLRGRSAFPQGPGDKAAGHVPLSPAARAPHAHCWGAAARLVYLFVCCLQQSLSARLAASCGAQPEFPSRERVRGILNRKPDPENSDQTSSDYSPLAPPSLPPPPDLHKKGQENAGRAPAVAHSVPPGRSPLELRADLLRGAERTAPRRHSPRSRRPGVPTARFPGPEPR